MTAVTWGHVHVGDTVRGADQRPWTVVGRDTEREWVSEGREAAFELELGDRTVRTWRMLADPAPLVARADHSNMARAVQHLIDNDIRFTIIEERRSMTTVEPEAAKAPSEFGKVSNGRYVLPDPATGKRSLYTRVSNVTKVLEDNFGLVKWGERMVAKGMALRPDLVAGAAAADLEADKSTLYDIAQQAKDIAGSKTGSNLGTALHTFTERMDRGEPLKALHAPPPLGADLRAYQKKVFAAQLAVLPEFIERVVLCAHLGKGIAGTLDRVVKTAGGQLRILDLKTGKNLDYGWMEIAQQQAIYANASHCWNPLTEAYEPMPEGIDKQVGYILHLPVGKAAPQLYMVNLAEGWRLAQIAIDVKAARAKSKDLAQVTLIETPDDVMKQVTKAETQQALADLWATYQPRGLWTSEVNAYAQARLRHITAGVTVSATAT